MRLKKQLEQDFPNKDTIYNIASSINIVNDGNTLFSNDLFGVLKELSKQSAKGKDSIGIDVNSVRDYLNKNIIMGIENMKDNPLELKKDKWKADSTFFDILSTDQGEINKRSIELHKSLWQMNPCAKIVVDDLEYDPKDWEIEEMDNMLLFTYMNKAGFLGIVKYRSFLTLYVNPLDYKLYKLEERVNAQVNIPIGVKLKGDMLRLLNVINFGEKDFEKFRLRHAKIDLVRNVLYNEGLSTNLPLEKNVIVYMQLEDNRKNVLKGKSTAKTIIN